MSSRSSRPPRAARARTARVARGLALALTLAAAAVAAPRAARAESAKEAYARGLSLYAAGSYKDAAAAFVAAYELKHKPLILFNIGQAYRKQGDHEQALTYYRRFLDEASPEERAPLADETRKYIKEIEAELALKRSLIDKADAEEARSLDFHKGAARGTTPAGSASAAGAATSGGPATAGASPASGTTAATADLTATAPPTRHEHTPVYKSWWLWTAVGVAAVGLAVGLGVGLGSSHDNNPPTALGTRQATF